MGMAWTLLSPLLFFTRMVCHYITHEGLYAIKRLNQIKSSICACQRLFTSWKSLICLLDNLFSFLFVNSYQYIEHLNQWLPTITKKITKKAWSLQKNGWALKFLNIFSIIAVTRIFYLYFCKHDNFWYQQWATRIKRLWNADLNHFI